MKSPTPGEVMKARDAVGLTQLEAAECTMSALRTWQSWESETDSRRRMPAAIFELFLLRTGQKKVELYHKWK